MALFGDLGKALGLGSGKDVLPVLGSALGFYFGGPMGSALGSGIGTLAGGGKVDDVLKNAALSYGVTSFLPAGLSKTGEQSFLNEKIYGSFGSTGNVSVPKAGIDTLSMSDADLYDNALSGGSSSSGGSLLGSAFDFVTDNPLLTLGVGSALFADKPEEGGPPRPYAEVSGFDINVVDPETGEILNIKDPEDAARYREAMTEARRTMYDNDRMQSIPGYAHGGAMVDHPEAKGAMYEHKKMGYDVPALGEVEGPGTGTSDSVPARLSDGEFVLTAKAVRGAGGGDRDIGAARLYDMMAELEATA